MPQGSAWAGIFLIALGWVRIKKAQPSPWADLSKWTLVTLPNILKKEIVKGVKFPCPNGPNFIINFDISLTSAPITVSNIIFHFQQLRLCVMRTVLYSVRTTQPTFPEWALSATARAESLRTVLSAARSCAIARKWRIWHPLSRILKVPSRIARKVKNMAHIEHCQILLHKNVNF